MNINDITNYKRRIGNEFNKFIRKIVDINRNMYIIRQKVYKGNKIIDKQHKNNITRKKHFNKRGKKTIKTKYQEQEKKQKQ